MHLFSDISEYAGIRALQNAYYITDLKRIFFGTKPVCVADAFQF